MFEISVKSHFSSAHHLRGYQGPCHEVHGHNWAVEVFLRGTRTDAIGMLMDFGKIKAAVREALQALDHKDLNCLPAFVRVNPTSENLAKYLYIVLANAFRHEPCRVQRVLVSESPGTSACYWEDVEAGASGNETGKRGHSPRNRKIPNKFFVGAINSELHKTGKKILPQRTQRSQRKWDKDP